MQRSPAGCRLRMGSPAVTKPARASGVTGAMARRLPLTTGSPAVTSPASASGVTAGVSPSLSVSVARTELSACVGSEEIPNPTQQGQRVGAVQPAGCR